MFSLFRKKKSNYKDIDPDQFQELMSEKDHFILDVRSSQEFSEGAIEGYVQINFQDKNFKAEIDKLDRSKTYLVYCRSGNRSGRACYLMSSMNFDNLYNLKGGIYAWKKWKA